MRSIIYGAGSFGHELAEFVCDVRKKSLDEKNFILFIDDTDKTESENSAWEIAGNFENFKFCDSDHIYIGFGDPIQRNIAFKKIKKLGLSTQSLIHPTAYISKDCEITEGCIVGPFCTVGYKAKLQENVMLNSYVAIGHHAVIGSSSVLSPKSLVTGRSELGNCCFMGSGAIITPGKKVSDNVSIGAGSVVYRNVKANTKVFGNPARKKL